MHIHVLRQVEAGFKVRPALKHGAIPTVQPVPTPEQLIKEQEAYERARKRGLRPSPLSRPSIAGQPMDPVYGKRAKLHKKGVVTQKLEVNRASGPIYWPNFPYHVLLT